MPNPIQWHLDPRVTLRHTDNQEVRLDEDLKGVVVGVNNKTLSLSPDEALQLAELLDDWRGVQVKRERIRQAAERARDS